MLLELDDLWAVWLSAVVAAALSLLAGWWATGWSVGRVARPGPLTRLRAWEQDGTWWARHLAVRRWKDALPEAGALFGGYAKDHIRSRTTADLDRFRAETIRAERVHWLSAATGVLHLLSCRPSLAVALAALGVAGNAPFIVIQRTNRGRLDRLLRRRHDRRTAATRPRSGAADDPAAELNRRLGLARDVLHAVPVRRALPQPHRPRAQPGPLGKGRP